MKQRSRQIIFLTIVCSCLFYFFGKQEKALPPVTRVTAIPEIHNISKSDLIIAKDNSQVNKGAMENSTRLHKKVDTDSNVQTTVSGGNVKAWGIVGTPESPPALKLEAEVQYAEQIIVDTKALSNLTIGQVVDLELSGSSMVSAVIEKKRVFPNGDISWNGHLESEGDDFPVTITIGKQVSFATITTPSGEYTVEAEGDKGWVYENPDMSHLQDEENPDVLIPGQQLIEEPAS